MSLKPSTYGLFASAAEGTPLLIRTIALRVALLATLSAVTSISTQALAAHQIVWTLWSFAAYVLDALAIALKHWPASRRARASAAPCSHSCAP